MTVSELYNCCYSIVSTTPVALYIGEDLISVRPAIEVADRYKNEEVYTFGLSVNEHIKGKVVRIELVPSMRTIPNVPLSPRERMEAQVECDILNQRGIESVKKP